jgi:hypothetical protein
MYLPYGLNPMARVPFIAKGVTRKECKNAPISLPMYKIKVSIEKTNIKKQQNWNIFRPWIKYKQILFLLESVEF